MKKYFSLFMLAMVLVMPFNVNAELAASLPVKESVDSCPNDVCTKEVEFYFISEDGTTTTFEKTSPLTGSFEYGADVTLEGVESSLSFNLALSGDNLTVTPVSDTVEVSDSEELLVGTVIVTYPKDSTDCDVRLMLGDSEADIHNPETGVSLPMVTLGAVAVLGIGVYCVTRKNNKLFKI